MNQDKVYLTAKNLAGEVPTTEYLCELPEALNGIRVLATRSFFITENGTRSTPWFRLPGNGALPRLQYSEFTYEEIRKEEAVAILLAADLLEKKPL
jgi:hypothetical protein